MLADGVASTGPSAVASALRAAADRRTRAGSICPEGDSDPWSATITSGIYFLELVSTDYDLARPPYLYVEVITYDSAQRRCRRR